LIHPHHEVQNNLKKQKSVLQSCHKPVSSWFPASAPWADQFDPLLELRSTSSIALWEVAPAEALPAAEPVDIASPPEKQHSLSTWSTSKGFMHLFSLYALPKYYGLKVCLQAQNPDH
jgi:hypothetical protein